MGIKKFRKLIFRYIKSTIFTSLKKYDYVLIDYLCVHQFPDVISKVKKQYPREKIRMYIDKGSPILKGNRYKEYLYLGEGELMIFSEIAKIRADCGPDQKIRFLVISADSDVFSLMLRSHEKHVSLMYVTTSEFYKIKSRDARNQIFKLMGSEDENFINDIAFLIQLYGNDYTQKVFSSTYDVLLKEYKRYYMDCEEFIVQNGRPVYKRFKSFLRINYYSDVSHHLYYVNLWFYLYFQPRPHHNTELGIFSTNSFEDSTYINVLLNDERLVFNVSLDTIAEEIDKFNSFYLPLPIFRTSDYIDMC